MSRIYDAFAYDYNEKEALQQLANITKKVAIEENERIMRREHVDYCESFTISIGGVQIAFKLNAPQCCALDAFIEVLANENEHTIDN